MPNESAERGIFEAALAVVVEQQCARFGVEPQHAEKKPEVANARDDERLFRRRGRARLVIPETNQQIRRQPDQLPANEEEQQAVGDDHTQHCGGEQRHEAKETSEVLVVRHVAHAVDENEQADERDHDQHHRRERVEHPAELQPCTTKLEPVEIMSLPFHSCSRMFAKRFHERPTRKQK